jgi:hypothetical protein
MDGTAILVDAERRFMKKLCDAMVPVMLDAFWEMYLESKKESKGRNTLNVFQIYLQKVKKDWTDVIVKQHVDAILKEQPLFPNLLAAVFVIHVKILSSIRTNNQSKKLSIKLPGNNLFVHSCYIEAAKRIYTLNQEGEPVFNDSITDAARKSKLGGVFCDSIKETVDSLVPIETIMMTYLGTLPDENMLDIDQGEEAMETDEPDIDEAEPMNVEPQEQEPDVPPPIDSAETPGGHLVKEVAVTPGPTSIPGENLFDDAAETKPARSIPI